MADNAKKPIDNEEEIIAEQAAENTEAVEQVEVSTAKAGKRSAKSLAEADEKEAKEERKAAIASGELEAEKPKQHSNPTRSRLERQGKKFREAAKLIETDKVYTLKEAIALAQKTNPAKFDASVEVHINLNVDPRHADQNIRDNLVLPAGTGKKIRVAVFADETVEGADIQGVDNITKALDKGEIAFDILIATPAQMPKLGKYARTLGPRGLMPNPKSGTVTTDVAKAVKEAKAGRVEYRVDTTGIVHMPVGKVSFKSEDLLKNLQAVFASVKGNKPSSVKGTYVKAIYLTTSMGPSIVVAVSEV
jgi:large subunit ribosomal protein L1